MNNIEVDNRQVINLFAELTSRQQKQVHRNALRRAAGILSKETKLQFRKVLGRAANHKNWWNGKTLISGIRVKANKEGTESKVHIMGDFRLKFFEMGTNKRTIKKGKNKDKSTGRIKSSYFFRTAKENKEQEIFSTIDKLVSQSIQRISDKNRK